MEHDTQYWSLDKRINLSHIFTTAAMLVSLFVWGNKMDQRVTTLEANLENSRISMSALDTRLNRIEDKLDRLIEKSSR